MMRSASSDIKQGNISLSNKKSATRERTCGFCECIEAGDDALLQIIIETTDLCDARSLCRDFKDIGPVSFRQINAKYQIVLLVSSYADFDVHLIHIQEKIDKVNGQNQTIRAELIDTRLIDASVSAEDATAVVRTQIGSFVLVDSFTVECNPHEILFAGGTAFGSGCHPSTRLAASLLEKAVAVMDVTKVLDVGCGSGVLSLLSAKLGVRHTVGLDVCHNSLVVARSNIEANGLNDRIDITGMPIGEVSCSFDLVLANLTLSVFFYLLDDINRLCRNGGVLVVSGLQGRQDESALARLHEYGWELLTRSSEGKWQAMMLRRI